MGNNKVFYGMINISLGIVAYFLSMQVIPSILLMLNIECTDEFIISCAGLMSLIQIISIVIVVVGLLEIIYWYFFERKRLPKEKLTNYKVCPQCNTINDKNAKYCKECGYKF